MANYNPMKKAELIKVLKERDAAIAGLEETNRQLVKDNDEFSAKINGLERDCEGMTEECNNLRNKVNGLTDDYNNAVKERNAFANYKDLYRNQSKDIVKLQKQRVVLTAIAFVAIVLIFVL